MKSRLILVINPRSSGFSMVQKKIISHLDEVHFEKNQLITFEVQPTSPLENARELAKGLQDNDIILVAGGDGTAHIASNAAAFSGKKIKIKYTGFGNFNDYAHSFSKNSGKSAVKAIKTQKVVAKIRPLEIRVNGDFFRYAPLYATVGLTAEMADIFEGKRLRKALKKVRNRNSRLILSLLAATRFYFKNRKKSILKISEIEIQGEKLNSIPKKTTDLVFMNGPRMARIMRSKINKTDSENFGFTAMNSGDFRANLPFLLRGIFGKIPLKRTKSAKIIFQKPAKITIQIEGEVQILKNVETLEVRISKEKIEIL